MPKSKQRFHGFYKCNKSKYEEKLNIQKIKQTILLIIVQKRWDKSQWKCISRLEINKLDQLLLKIKQSKASNLEFINIKLFLASY